MECFFDDPEFKEGMTVVCRHNGIKLQFVGRTTAAYREGGFVLRRSSTFDGADLEIYKPHDKAHFLSEKQYDKYKRELGL